MSITSKLQSDISTYNWDQYTKYYDFYHPDKGNPTIPTCLDSSRFRQLGSLISAPPFKMDERYSIAFCKDETSLFYATRGKYPGIVSGFTDWSTQDLLAGLDFCQEYSIAYQHCIENRLVYRLSGAGDESIWNFMVASLRVGAVDWAVRAMEEMRHEVMYESVSWDPVYYQDMYKVGV